MNKAKPKSINPQPQAGNALGSERRRKPRAPKSFTTGDAAQPPSSTTNEEVGTAEISPEERQRMIEEAAYYCAQRRQSEGRYSAPDEDWAEAEAQIQRMLEERRNKGRT